MTISKNCLNMIKIIDPNCNLSNEEIIKCIEENQKTVNNFAKNKKNEC